MERVLIYEPQHTGHHLPYLARMLPGLLSLPIEVTLATTRATVASEQFAAELGALRSRLRIIDDCRVPKKGRPVRYALGALWELRRLMRRERPDHVIIMYGDALWIVQSALHLATGGLIGGPMRGVSSEIILYRGGFAYPDAPGRGARVKRWLFAHALRAGLHDRWHLDDEIMHDFAVRSLSGCEDARARSAVLPPNPVRIEGDADAASARAELGLPSGPRIISLTGAIAGYKGADLLVRAFAAHHDAEGEARARDDVLVLAGPHEQEVRDALAEPRARRLVDDGHIISIDRFLSAHEMFAFAAASNVVAAPYPNHSGRSSIILWAAAAGRPVLASARGTIGFVTRTNSMGLTVDPRDHDALVRSIGAALGMPWSREDERRVRLYAREHSFERYRAHMSGFVRAQLDRDRIDGHGASVGA